MRLLPKHCMARHLGLQLLFNNSAAVTKIRTSTLLLAPYCAALDKQMLEHSSTDKRATTVICFACCSVAPLLHKQHLFLHLIKHLLRGRQQTRLVGLLNNKNNLKCWQLLLSRV
jgi:hypothetical protein